MYFTLSSEFLILVLFILCTRFLRLAREMRSHSGLGSISATLSSPVFVPPREGVSVGSFLEQREVIGPNSGCILLKPFVLLLVRLRNNRINGNRISEKQINNNNKKQTNKKKGRVIRERTDMRKRNCHTRWNIARFTAVPTTANWVLSSIFQLITCTESTREDEHQELSVFLTSRLCEGQNVF